MALSQRHCCTWCINSLHCLLCQTCVLLTTFNPCIWKGYFIPAAATIILVYNHLYIMEVIKTMFPEQPIRHYNTLLLQVLLSSWESEIYSETFGCQLHRILQCALTYNRSACHTFPALLLGFPIHSAMHCYVEVTLTSKHIVTDMLHSSSILWYIMLLYLVPSH